MFYNEITLDKGGIAMASEKIITFECEQCGTEVVVTAAGEMELSPIYCCGMVVTEVSSPQKKAVKVKKVAAKKTTAKKTPAKKAVASKVAAKKKPSPKKSVKK